MKSQHVPIGCAALLLVLAGCSSPHGTPTPASTVVQTAPDGEVVRARLKIVVKVINTHFGSAIPSDFTLSVSGVKEAQPVTVVPAATGEITVPVHAGVGYEVTIAAGPDGYVSQMTGCSGVIDQVSVTCTVTESDVALTCDETFWAPVYIKDRLRVLSACEAASGTVDHTSIEHDGDLILYLRLDGPFQRLLGPGNADKGNTLIVEIPCQDPIDQTDAKGTCDRYQGPKIKVPSPGTRVAAAAHWVEDRNHHMWRELHGARVIRLPR